MSYQNIFKRYEMKYLLTIPQQTALFECMKPYMTPDSFGESTICNIYFDTPDKRLIRKSLERPCYKEKLRVRSYGIASTDSTVFIELKKKYNGIVYKRRLALMEHIAFDSLLHHTPLPVNDQIAKELAYFIDYYGEIEPSVFLSYDRKAFFSNTDENFRMTFDRNIKMREDQLSLTDNTDGENILSSQYVLLEVKTSLGIPPWLFHFLSKQKIYKTSFSKYGTAYTQILLPKHLGGSTYVA